MPPQLVHDPCRYRWARQLGEPGGARCVAAGLQLRREALALSYECLVRRLVQRHQCFVVAGRHLDDGTRRKRRRNQRGARGKVEVGWRPRFDPSRSGAQYLWPSTGSGTWSISLLRGFVGLRTLEQAIASSLSYVDLPVLHENTVRAALRDEELSLIRRSKPSPFASKLG